MINLGNIEFADLRLGASQVKALYLGSEQIWGGEEPGPIGDWLCFTSEQNGSTLRLDKSYSPGTIYLETSDDGGDSWKDYTWSGNTGTQFGNLNVGDKVYFRAKTENQSIGGDGGYYKFVMTGKIAASGNIQSLLKADCSRTDAPAHCYQYTFQGCSSLTTAPELPATTLANSCYSGMFKGCTSLTSAPVLSETAIAESCYSGMFSGCTSLTTAPVLSSTSLAGGCYSGMFKGCTSLTSAPALPATTLVSQCYYSMFENCTSLTAAPVLPAMTLNYSSCNSMFKGCTSLTTAPALPATSVAMYGYQAMFSGCTSLTSAPALPATSLAEGCYSYMFNGCTSLTAVPVLPATTLADGCYSHMFENCTSLTTAPVLPAMSITYRDYNCYGSMFKGCTSLTSAPALPATTLGQNCYSGMFSGCSSLTTAPELPATTLANSCYSGMFSGCTSLTSAPALPATSLAEGCYSYMFNGCTSLTSAPELPATTIASECYNGMFENCTSLTAAPVLPAMTATWTCYGGMFKGCTSLSSAPALPATTLAYGSYQEMFSGCSSLTDAPSLPATTLTSNCYYRMFYGCSSLSSMEVAFTAWGPTYETDNWLSGVAATGTFTCPAALQDDMRGVSYIPVGWTVAHPAVAALRFDILADDTSIDLVNDSGTLEPPDLEYSVDDGTTWTQWVPGSDYPHEMAGAVVYVRAGATGNTGFGTGSEDPYWHFTSDDLFSVSGNIMYLLSRDGSTGVSNYCFFGLFQGCTMLVDASGLELPATTLANSCYQSMFNGCTSLTTAPELPATTLANGCYRIMFSNCSSLSAAPELSATTLATYCYQQMFQNCTSLSTAQTALPATTLSSWCYTSMFAGCSSLTDAPALPATTLTQNCYNGMFNGCSSLSSMEVAFTAWGPANATMNWLNNVAASGTFTCPAELSDIRGDSNIPTGWQVLHPVEYIEADSQQYLDTGYAPQVGDEIELTWANTDNTKENKGFLVGSYWGGGGRVADGQVKPWIYPGITGAGFSTPSNFYTNAMTIGEKFTDHMYVGTLASGKYGYTMYRHLTDTLYSYNEWSGSVRNENISLCGRSGDASSLANKRIYGWKHWRNGALIRDMIPINYNGAGAMYDNVSQTVFTSGSGVDFLLPNAS